MQQSPELWTLWTMWTPWTEIRLIYVHSVYSVHLVHFLLVYALLSPKGPRRQLFYISDLSTIVGAGLHAPIWATHAVAGNPLNRA